MNSGVYKIINTVNGKFYIGSSEKLTKRFAQHISELKSRKHHCGHLQKAWDKYGEQNFKLEILVKCPKEYVLKLEQWFIDNLKPEYNICPIAGSAKGRKLTELHKEKLRQANLGKAFTEERIKNITEGRRKADNPEFREKQRINATGKLKSQESKDKNSISQKEKLKNPEVYRKRIEQLNLARSKRFKPTT